MKCLNCQRKGSHFDRKICPPCIDEGVTRADIIVDRKQAEFIGRKPGDDAREYLQEMREEGRNISHVREKTIMHPHDETKNKVILSWNEYSKKEQ